MLSFQVAAVATLMNVGTLRDYLFRNYNLPPGSISFYQGSAKYRLWEALRASSAAPGYFEEFKLDDYVFQVRINYPTSSFRLHRSLINVLR